MSRLRELIDELCPDGVEYKKLGEVGTLTKGRGLQKKDFSESGIGCIHYGQIYTRLGMKAYETLTFVPEDKADGFTWVERNDIVIAITSENVEDVCKAVLWLGEDRIVTGAHAAVYHATAIEPVFVAYFLQSTEFQNKKVMMVDGVKVIEMKVDQLSKVSIPVPPIEVQREIVRILDSFQELDDALTAEIEAREKQYRFAQEQCFVKHFGNPAPSKPSSDTVKLGDLYDVTSSQRIYQSEQSAGGVPFLRVSDLIAKMDGRNVEGNLFISEDMYQSLVDADHVPVLGDILVTARGTLGRYYFIDKDDKFYFQDGMITWLRMTRNSPSHAFFSALFSNERFLDRLISNCGQGTVKYLSIKGLSNALVPKPDADKLESFDNEMSEFEQIARLSSDIRAERDARRKQFEHYRDRLLSFPKKEA